MNMQQMRGAVFVSLEWIVRWIAARPKGALLLWIISNVAAFALGLWIG